MMQAINSVGKTLFLVSLTIVLYGELQLALNAGGRPSILKRSYTGTLKGKKVQFEIAQIDPNKMKVQVISVYSFLQGRSKNAPSYNLQELIDKLKPQAIINGGFSASFSIPTPTGLLVSNGKIIYQMNTVGKITNGIFCVGKRISIVTSNNYRQSNCIDALQSGPILVNSGQVDGKLNQLPINKGEHRRSVVAIDKQGRLLLIAVTTPITLLDLASLLSQKDLNCVSALNLGGSTDSGLYINTQVSRSQVGQLNTPIASAIAVFQK